MGLIKALANAAGSVLGDQWREYFYCDSLSDDILVVKGQKRTSDTRNSSNKKGENNIISNGSIIAVNEGQCMIIVDQGKVVELCAEAGEFVYDKSTEPSIFYGGLGQGILKSFSTLGKRITFGGDTAKDQRVYYFNTKEIKDNKFGTPAAIPFRIVDKNVGLDLDSAVRINGNYSYHITDPLLFYTNVCGNIVDEYNRNNLTEQLRGELLTSLQPALAAVSAQSIRYYELPGATKQLVGALNTELSPLWSEKRGIEIVIMNINSAKISEEDEKMVKDLQRTATLKDRNMAAATLVGSQAKAMEAAASNTSTGPMMAFAGMNMANMAGGMNANTLFEMGTQQNAQAQEAAAQKNVAAVAATVWDCACGHKGNTRRFCGECGTKNPNEGWTCSCGTVNKGKFCQNCGSKKPAGVPQYKCDKCGWEPEDPTNPPKFCPECGDPFNDGDIQ